MLDSRGDAHVPVSIAVHEQELDLSDGGIQDGRCGGVADGRVSINDFVVVGGVGRIVTDLTENLFLKVMHIGAIHTGSIHIGDGGINVGEEQRIVLLGLDQRTGILLKMR